MLPNQVPLNPTPVGGPQVRSGPAIGRALLRLAADCAPGIGHSLLRLAADCAPGRLRMRQRPRGGERGGRPMGRGTPQGGRPGDGRVPVPTSGCGCGGRGVKGRRSGSFAVSSDAGGAVTASSGEVGLELKLQLLEKPERQGGNEGDK